MKFKTLKQVENEYIINTVEFFKGNMTKSSESLGIAKSTLYRKLNEIKQEKDDEK